MNNTMSQMFIAPPFGFANVDNAELNINYNVNKSISSKINMRKNGDNITLHTVTRKGGKSTEDKLNFTSKDLANIMTDIDSANMNDLSKRLTRIVKRSKTKKMRKRARGRKTYRRKKKSNRN